MTTNKRIEGWWTVPGGDRYTPPEMAGICIVGVFGEDGDGARWIRTSLVTSAKGRTITTRSGSTYELGDPDPKFLALLRANDYPFDPENPIQKVDTRTVLIHPGDPDKN